MKRALILSVLLHITLIALSFYLYQERKTEEKPPFTARIITPEELKQFGIEPLKEEPPRFTPPSRPSRATPPSPKVAPAPRSRTTPATPKQPARRPSPPGDVGQRGVTPLPKEAQKPPTASVQPSPTAPQPSAPSAGSPGSTPSRSLRDSLFDRDIIAKYAPTPQEAPKERPRDERGITFDSRDIQYSGYMQRLKERIEGIWRYPAEAAQRGLYGDLYIRFTIRRDGSLGAVELVRTSGHRNLDDAALRALREAAPFWPLPEDWNRESFTITGHFIYTLYGTYIR